MSEGPGDAKKGLLDLDEPGLDPSNVESGLTAAPTPTIRPEFSPEKYAEESEFRERMPTLTDDSLLEEARLQSMHSNAPPARPPMPSASGMTATTARPGPPDSVAVDSVVEIDMGESDLDSLDVADQVAIFLSRLMPLSRVPVLARAMAELGAVVEDPKTAYVLGFIDGLLPLETIVEVTGLPELETLHVLDRMVSLGVVTFKPPRAR